MLTKTEIILNTYSCLADGFSLLLKKKNSSNIKIKSCLINQA